MQFEVVDERRDYPVVGFLVDGWDPFVVAAPGSVGHDPTKILCPRSPLLPKERARRVALYYCPSGGKVIACQACTSTESSTSRRLSAPPPTNAGRPACAARPGWSTSGCYHWGLYCRQTSPCTRLGQRGREDGVDLMFLRVTRADRITVRQQLLRLTSTLDDPGQAAEDMAQQLLSVSPDEWAGSFGWFRYPP